MQSNFLFNKLIMGLFLCFSTLSVFAAHTPKTFIVKTQNITQKLYFNGTISPIDNVPVISPTQGVVEKKLFTYGQIVKKNQPLLIVNTRKVTENLRNAKVAFFKAWASYQKKQKWASSKTVISAQNSLIQNKQHMERAKVTSQENQRLYKLGIISRDQLQQGIDSYDDAKMSYQQAQMSLQSALKQGEGNNFLATKLQYENAKQKYDSLQSQVKSSIILSPATGIALVPKNTNTSSKSQITQVAVGSTIQFQQALLNIGNLQGIRITFNIPEVNIDKVYPSLKATVTSAAFPDVTLHGTLTEVAAQASTQNSGGGSAPVFAAKVSVPHITNTQRKLIRSGMDAQVAITIAKNRASLVVPVNAVTHNQHGQSVVMLYNVTTRQQTQQVVITGKVGLTNCTNCLRP